MSNEFMLKIMTPGKIAVEEEVEKVFVKTENGQIEFLKNHAPIIVSVVPAITIFYKKNGEKQEVFTSNGVINLTNNNLILLTDAAEFENEVDLDRAVEAKDRAVNRLKKKEKIDEARAKLALARAIVRIDFKKHTI